MTSIGFGAFKIGRNEGIKYPQGYALPDDREAEALLNGVLDAGINYIDTAPAYGSSEERIGRFLGWRRGEFVLSTKVGETFEKGRSSYDFSRAAVEASVSRSLKRLRCEAVDIVFIHAGGGDDLAILRETPVIETLLSLRRRGLTRAVGLSGKTVAAAEAAIAWADVLMVEYHALDRSHEAVMRLAAAAGVGVVVKKGLASGRLRPGEAIPMVLRTEGVGSLVVGGLSLDHLRENIRIAEETLR